ncbi:MAG: hypothetical protein ABIH22_02635 [Candidatus Margulisiibacteriota bacterium]
MVRIGRVIKFAARAALMSLPLVAGCGKSHKSVPLNGVHDYLTGSARHDWHPAATFAVKKYCPEAKLSDELVASVVKTLVEANKQHLENEVEGARWFDLSKPGGVDHRSLFSSGDTEVFIPMFEGTLKPTFCPVNDAGVPEAGSKDAGKPKQDKPDAKVIDLDEEPDAGAKAAPTSPTRPPSTVPKGTGTPVAPPVPKASAAPTAKPIIVMPGREGR